MRILDIGYTVALAAALAIFATAPAPAAPSDLDPSFGTGGRATIDVGHNDQGYRGALQPDGKIVIAGPVHKPTDTDFGIARLTPSGNPDPDFAGGSGATVFNPTPEDDWVNGLAIQPDGKLLIGGYLKNMNRDVGVLRLRADGLPDATFGAGGLGTFSSIATNIGGGVLHLPDGKVLWVGRGNNNMNLVRFNPNGSLDGTFGIDGRVSHSLSPGHLEQYRAVVRQPDGKILIGGEANGFGPGVNFVVARVHPNGVLDSTFGANGFVNTHFQEDDFLNDLALQPDGKIVAVGSGGGAARIAVARYLPNGSLDASFSGNGRHVIDLGGTFNVGYGVDIQADGKIVLAATTNATGVRNMAIHRLTTGGADDSTLGVSGTRVVDFEGGNDNARDVLVQPDGKIVAVGWAVVGGQSEFAAVRLEGDPVTGSEDPSVDPADSSVALVVARRLRVNRRGIVRLAARCPATEQSPPCRARVMVVTPRLRLRPGARPRRVALGRTTIRLSAGETGAFRFRMGSARQRLIASNRRARRVAILRGRVANAAGNTATMTQRLRIVSPRR